MKFMTGMIISMASVVLLGLFTGCGPASGTLAPLIQVKGKVTYKGQPVTQGMIRFEPDGYGRMATGKIESDGSFTLSTLGKDDGVVAGTHKVFITGTAPAGKKDLIPKKYTQAGSTDLVAEVDPEHIEFTFNLIDGK
jgi:hypothetical protein